MPTYGPLLADLSQATMTPTGGDPANIADLLAPIANENSAALVVGTPTAAAGKPGPLSLGGAHLVPAVNASMALDNSGKMGVAAVQALASISLSSPLSPLSGGQGASPVLLPHWRAAAAKVQAGVAGSYPRVVFIGDSTIRGGSQAGGTNVQNLTYFLAKYLSAAGITANNNGVMGSGPTGAEFDTLTTDSRFVAGSWVQSAFQTLGGEAITASSGSAPLVFTPLSGSPTKSEIDTFLVHYVATLTEYGSFSATATGGTAVVGNGSQGANELLTLTASAAAAAASNALSVAWENSLIEGPTILGLDAYLSTQPSVQIINGGITGSVAAQITQPFGFPFDCLSMLKYLAPALTVIEFGPNDWAAGTTATALQATLQQIITAALTTGDAILVIGTPNDTGAAVQETYIPMAYALASANNIPVLDLNRRWVSYDVTNPLGLYADAVHPSSIGYADQARALANLLMV